MKRHPPLHGLIAAPFTPFHQDGTLNENRIEAQAERLLHDGVSGAFVCGTTGEGPSMSTAERMRVTERWIACGQSLRIVVHVGHCSVEESRALAAHAQQKGATGVGCLSPYFFKPRSVVELSDFCALVAAAAPDLPFYYYHIPSVTGVNLSMSEFLKVASSKIPNLAGIKFTHEDLHEFLICQRMEGGRFEMLFGRDEMLLSALACGAKGAIGSTYNYIAPIYLELIRAFERGDLELARAAQAKASEIIAVMISAGGMPAGKKMMALTGIDCGGLRLPCWNLDDEAQNRLVGALKKTAFPFL